MGSAEHSNGAGARTYGEELRPGTKLLQGQYTIVQFINSGGFGMTYLARDSLDRRVVIKECFPATFCTRSDSIVRARSRSQQNEFRSIVRLFVQEARRLSKLDHPNIVGVHQVFEDNETAYMALDFVDGLDLLDILEDSRRRLTPMEIRSILKNVLRAVDYIHSQDVLHRDISPDNILLDRAGNPILIDFGAAREKATKASRALSALLVVKDGYSPQEFYLAGSPQSPSSDLYALAATFYHVLTGNPPPNSQERVAKIAANEPDPYKPIVGQVEGYDRPFLQAIDKALSIVPKDRLQSADDWLEIIDEERRRQLALARAQDDEATAASIAQLVIETNEAVRREIEKSGPTTREKAVKASQLVMRKVVKPRRAVYDPSEWPAPPQPKPQPAPEAPVIAETAKYIEPGVAGSSRMNVFRDARFMPKRRSGFRFFSIGRARVDQLGKAGS